MDGNTMVAIASGFFGLVGGLLVFKREVTKIRADKDTADKADERERSNRVDSNVWKLLDEIRKERHEIKVERDELQGLYKQAIERIELLEKQRLRDEQKSWICSCRSRN